MDVQVLGPLTTDGETLSPRERSILSALIIRSGSPVSAGELADAYWGAEPPVTWLQQVKTSIARIRRRLGPAAVRTVAGGYALGLDPEVVDAVRFERLVSAARAHMLHDEAERAADAYRRALRLWHGSAYPDVGSWAPGVAESFRLGEIRQTAEEELLEARLALGEHHALVADAERLVRDDPLRETRWAILALAAYRSDRQADALATIQTARTRLRDELGIEPGRRLTDLEGAILRQDPALDAPVTRTPSPQTDCPYRGLDAFGAEDAETFFGRDADIERLLERIVPGAFVTLTGASGSGKSSILLAGLVPRLRQRGIPIDLVRPLHFDDLPTPREHSVVVIDQFEELFAHTDVYVAARAAALRDLVARGGTVVIAMRSDFLDRCLAQPDLAQLIGDGIQPVLPLGAAQLRDVVEEPARSYGLRLEPGLVELILRDTVDRPTALPMLSHALLETWRRREGSVLTVDGYEAAGGIAGAVANSAEELYRSLSDDEQNQLRAVMLRLVERLPDGAIVRRRSPLGPLTDDPARARLIGRLVAARLVSVEAGTASVTHEALGIAWPRLDAWLREDALDASMLATISAAASSWIAGGRAEDELLRGARLQAMLEWRVAAQPDLTADESALLAASEARADEELRAEQQRVAAARRQNRRLRWALGGAAVLLVVAIVTGSLAVVRSHEAAVAAENSQIDAVVSTSLATRQNDRDIAALLAAEAYRRWPDDGRVRSALLGTVTAANGLLYTHHVAGADPTVTTAIPGTGTALQMRNGEVGVLELIDVATGDVRRTFDVDLSRALDIERGGDVMQRFVRVSDDGHVAVVLSMPFPDYRAPDCCWMQLTFVDLQSGTTLPGTQVLRIRSSGLVALSADGAFAYLQHPVSGDLVAVDSHTGDVRVSSPAVYDSRVGEPYRFAAITVVDDDTVAAAVEDRIDLFSRASLTIERSLPLPSGTAGAFLAYDGLGGLLSSGPTGLSRVELATGHVTWSRMTAAEDACIQLVPLPTGHAACASMSEVTTFDAHTGEPTGRGFAVQVDNRPLLSVADERTILGSYPLLATWALWRTDGTGAGVDLVAPEQRMWDAPTPNGGLVGVEPIAGGPMQLWDLISSAPTGIESDGLSALSDDVIEYYDEGEGPGLQSIRSGARHAYDIPGLPDDFQLFDGGPGPLAFVFFDEQVIAFDPRTGEQVGVALRAPGAQMNVIASVSESPDGAHILVSWFDQARQALEAGVFRLRDGELLVRGLHGREYLVYNGPDEIIAATDQRMERIDPETFEVTSTFPRAEGGNRHLSVSRDGQTFLSVGWDNRVRLYELPRGIPLGDALALETSFTQDGPIGARLTADGKTLLTNSPAGVLAWDLRPKVQARAACAIAGRELTAEEWATYFPDDEQVATCAALAPR